MHYLALKFSKIKGMLYRSSSISSIIIIGDGDSTLDKPLVTVPPSLSRQQTVGLFTVSSSLGWYRIEEAGAVIAVTLAAVFVFLLAVVITVGAATGDEGEVGEEGSIKSSGVSTMFDCCNARCSSTTSALLYFSGDCCMVPASVAVRYTSK